MTIFGFVTLLIIQAIHIILQFFALFIAPNPEYVGRRLKWVSVVMVSYIAFLMMFLLVNSLTALHVIEITY